jgi:hypothetical protein
MRNTMLRRPSTGSSKHGRRDSLAGLSMDPNPYEVSIRRGVKFGVRRGKVLVFSGCNSHPATGSLQPVRLWRIGAAVEVTKPSEPSRQMCRLGDAASRQAVTRSERRAGLEMTNVDADLALRWGRPQPLANRETVGIGRPMSDLTQWATGVMTTACLHTEIQRNTGNPKR